MVARDPQERGEIARRAAKARHSVDTAIRQLADADLTEEQTGRLAALLPTPAHAALAEEQEASGWVEPHIDITAYMPFCPGCTAAGGACRFTSYEQYVNAWHVPGCAMLTDPSAAGWPIVPVQTSR